MIPFELKDYYTLFNEVVGYAQEHEIISTNIDFLSLIQENKDIENFTVLLLSIMSKLYSEVYTDMSDVKDGYNILEATGDDLDNLGAFKGISRPKATRCCVDLKFTLDNPLTETTTITTPIKVSTNDGILYSTVEDSKTVEKGSTEFYMVAYADTPGVNQRVSQDTLTFLDSGLPSIFGTCKVTNPYPATGGSEKATDSEYREYLLNSDKIHEKGTRWAYLNYLNRYDGLDSYNLVPQWDGTGTMKIIIDVSDNTQYHVQKIIEGVQENVAWADDDLTVVPATQVPITINMVCNVDIDQLNPYSNLEKTEIQARIIKAILVYINGGRRENGAYYKGLVIGEDFIPYKLGVFIDKEIVEVKNIIINNPSSPVTVKNDEIAFIDTENINVVME